MDIEHSCLDIETLSQFVSQSLNSNESFLHMILNVVDDIEAVICAKDISGRHYLVNRYYERAIGIPLSNVLGKTDHEIFSFSPEIATSIREKDIEVMENKKKCSFEEKVPDIDNNYRWYFTNKAPIFSHEGHVTGVVCLAIDITKQKILEEKLLKATQAKNTFLAKMSHEIRTPISAISGYLELAKNSDEEKCRSYLNKMTISADHLLNLVDDILDLSSIEENKLELNTVDFTVRHILDSVIDNLQHKALANNISIIKNYAADTNECFHGDKTRIKQIVFNLVSNAIKFSHDDNVEIRISVIKTKTTNQRKLIFLVKDHGIGIEPEKRKLVFKAFEQLNSSVHFFEGTGLGLSIVKELSELMGGSVKIFSQLNKGTIVAVSIPLMLSDNTCVQSEYCDDVKLNKKEMNLKERIICIVEDQAFNREILETMLTLAGASCISFEDGSDLIQAIEANEITQTIDCFLLDVHMPILSGPETLTRLRKYPKYKKSPAYIITADAIKSNVEEYLSCSQKLSGIFIKPIKRDELISVLHSLPIIDSKS